MARFGSVAALAITAWAGSRAWATTETQAPAAVSSSTAPALPSPPEPAATAPGAHLEVYVLTLGPGDHPFFKFGHNAIFVRDPDAGTDKVYNFGTFDFASPTLFIDFIKGRFTYWLSEQSWEETLWNYRHENRSIEAQMLDLTAAQKLALQKRLEVNLRPENREYLYDYYLDNCSTRVRDAVDAVLGGELRTQLARPGSLTFRGHTLRLMHDHPLYYGLLIVLGPFVDRPIDRWAEAFLPEKLRDGLRDAVITGPDGPRPLVKREILVFQARRAPLPDKPPFRVPLTGAGGVLFGGFLWTLGRLGARAGRSGRMVRAVFGVLTMVLGLLFGFLGSFFLYAWIGTNHVSAHRNENILACAPFALLLVGFGLGVARGRARPSWRALRVVQGAALLAALGLALKVLPWFRQDNLAVIAFCLPMWAGLALGLRAVAVSAAKTDTRSSGAPS